MKTKLLTALLTVLLSSPAFTQPVVTIGAADCGQWIARKGNNFTDIRTNSWLMGFMTGLNFDGRGKNLLSKVSAEQIFLWMDNYCKANPLDTVVKGGQILMEELDKR